MTDRKKAELMESIALVLLVALITSTYNFRTTWVHPNDMPRYDFGLMMCVEEE